MSEKEAIRAEYERAVINCDKAFEARMKHPTDAKLVAAHRQAISKKQSLWFNWRDFDETASATNT